MTRRVWAALALLAAVATIADARDRGPPPGERPGRGAAGGRTALNANPSALIAAEFALYRLAREKGLWRALRETAAAESVMFVPQRVKALEWLKRRDDPAAAIRFDPGEVWMSCDGGYGVVQGIWRQEQAWGRFVTVWQRQEKGEYKWALVRRDAATDVVDEPDMISAKVSDCSTNGGAPLSTVVAEGIDYRFGSSKDGSLYWREFYMPDGTWVFALQSWDGNAYPVVLSYVVAAQPVAE